jgi:hypothetical protein
MPQLLTYAPHGLLCCACAGAPAAMPDSQGGSFMRTSHSTMASARNLASSMGRESFRASSSVSGYGRESGAGWGLPSGLHSGSGEPWWWQSIGVT